MSLESCIPLSALLQTPTSSDIVLVWGYTQHHYWEDIATHLGCLPDYILNMESGENPVKYIIRVSGDWLAEKEGTGSLPRTWKTVLEAFKRSCFRSQNALSKLSSIETKLISNIEWY